MQSDLHIVVLVHLLIPEARDPLVSADHQPQRRGDIGRVDPEIGRPRSIDLDTQFRLIQFERDVCVDQPQLRGAQAQPLSIPDQLIEVRAPHREVDVGEPAAAAEIDRLRIADRRSQVGELAQSLANLLLHVARTVVPLENGKWLSPLEPLPEFRQIDGPFDVGRNAHKNTCTVDCPREEAASRPQ